MPGATLEYRTQVVLNDNGSAQWKLVPIGTWEPPTLHVTDVRCVMGAWPYIVVNDDRRLMRWERRRGSGWFLEDATSAKEPVQPFDMDARDWRPTRASAGRAPVVMSYVEDYKGIPYYGRRKPSMDIEDPVPGMQAGGLEAGEIPTVETATEGIEIVYVDCDLSDDEPNSPVYSPTSPKYSPSSPVMPESPICKVKGCVRCARAEETSVTVDPSQRTGNEHPTVEMVTGEAGARGLVVDPLSSAEEDSEDVAPRRVPKRRRKNVSPNRAKYPLAKYPC